MARRRESGFTLVELLVVISIIGMLMALILPAVNSVREVARRTSCSNQMQQMAKAGFNYITNKGSFPGYRGNRAGSSTTPVLDASWFVALSPYLERPEIKDRYDSFTAAAPNPLPYIEFAVCPSDPAEQLTPGPNNPISHLSYVANAGRQDPRQLNLQSPQPPDDEANGVFHDLRHPRSPKVILPVKDGNTNTLMFSENNQATKWSQVDEIEVTFVFDHNASHFDQNTGDLLPQFQGAAINNGKNNTAAIPRPSSNHPGGVNVAFCDSRTMFLKEDINYRVLQQLMTPDGFHRDCDVPSTAPNGQPAPGSNKAYVLNSADYTSQ
jgi:prepilin-type N-terminal cleavage/methylation domain-containing protein/prepilin-type processing-associated H-X9-DG protein